MKKITLLFVALIAAVSMNFAASGVVSGTVSNLPPGIYPPGLLVTVSIYDGTVINPTKLIYVDTVRTDANGFYSLPYSFSNPAVQGLAYSEFTDCNSFVRGDSTYWDTSSFKNPTINLNYCNTLPSGCNATFTSAASALGVSFTNNSTPIAGRITFSWSFGDGNFSNAVNPTHTYAVAGTYSVCLNMYDTTTNCSSNYCDTITVGSTPPPGKYISGDITANSLASGDAVVYLITADSNNFLTAVDSQLVGNALGSTYSFNVTQGLYYVKAALLASNPNFSSYLPTYYNKSLNWATATSVAVGGSAVTGININLIQGVNPGGPAFIGGLVSLGANKVAGPGDPYKGATVILTDDQGNAVAYDITDADGKYEFNNLAYGTYKLRIDMMNKVSDEITIVLDADNEEVNDINFLINSTEISTGINQLSNVALTGLYPNPAKENVSLTIDAKNSSTAQVVVVDILGKEVMNKQLNLAPGKQVINLNVSSIEEGLYLINVISGDEVKTQKFLKY